MLHCFTESVDVNVTPDKRQVFLEGETMILAVVKVCCKCLVDYEGRNPLYNLRSRYQCNSSFLPVMAKPKVGPSFVKITCYLGIFSYKIYYLPITCLKLKDFMM